MVKNYIIILYFLLTSSKLSGGGGGDLPCGTGAPPKLRVRGALIVQSLKAGAFTIPAEMFMLICPLCPVPPAKPGKNSWPLTWRERKREGGGDRMKKRVCEIMKRGVKMTG